MGKLEFSGNFVKSDLKVNVRVDVISFIEDGITILYCPALDISGYGKGEREAKESFELTLDEFFKYTINKGTFTSELKRLGWTIKSKRKFKATPPDMQKLLRDNEHFSDIFNNHDFRKFNTQIGMPQPAFV